LEAPQAIGRFLGKKISDIGLAFGFEQQFESKKSWLDLKLGPSRNSTMVFMPFRGRPFVDWSELWLWTLRFEMPFPGIANMWVSFARMLLLTGYGITLEAAPMWILRIPIYLSSSLFRKEKSTSTETSTIKASTREVIGPSR
jgi:hypothetical protein